MNTCVLIISACFSWSLLIMVCGIRIQFTRNILLFELFILSLNNAIEILPNECGLVVGECKNWKYRLVSGACNNLKNANWGTPNSTYDRLGPAKYGPDDSIALAVSGEPLPNARFLSNMIFSDETIPDKIHTINLPSNGQFVAHDMSHNMLIGSPQKSCTSDGQMLSKEPDNCASVEIPSNDLWYPMVNTGCIPILKTSTNKDLQCSQHLTDLRQISAVNNYLDLSPIYGNTDEECASLRSFKSGTLLSETREGQEWLTQSPNNELCPFSNPTTSCFRAGDPRVDQNPHLTILHIIWMREHNRVAKILAKLNPHWDDERLFQEARRIVIAEYQHIVYYGMLPEYLGCENMIANKIIYKTHFFVNDYDDEMRPHVINEHAQAAFRNFHSQIDASLNVVDETGDTYRTINLRDGINNPYLLERGDNFDGLTRGLNTQSCIATNRFVVPEMTRFFFLIFKKYSFDIKTADIQRGRIHGLCSYNDMRKICGLPAAADSFYTFLDTMDKESVELLRKTYAHPNDVDLVVGGALEKKIKGSLAGPTFLCILLKQFHRTRKSDRYFFENESSGLTLLQLNEIRKSSISKLYCDNGHNIIMMQRNGFQKVSMTNPRIPCASIEGPNLLMWKEEIC